MERMLENGQNNNFENINFIRRDFDEDSFLDQQTEYLEVPHKKKVDSNIDFSDNKGNLFHRKNDLGRNITVNNTFNVPGMNKTQNSKTSLSNLDNLNNPQNVNNYAIKYNKPGQKYSYQQDNMRLNNDIYLPMQNNEEAMDLKKFEATLRELDMPISDKLNVLENSPLYTKHNSKSISFNVNNDITRDIDLPGKDNLIRKVSHADKQTPTYVSSRKQELSNNAKLLERGQFENNNVITITNIKKKGSAEDSNQRQSMSMYNNPLSKTAVITRNVNHNYIKNVLWDAALIYGKREKYMNFDYNDFKANFPGLGKPYEVCIRWLTEMTKENSVYVPYKLNLDQQIIYSDITKNPIKDHFAGLKFDVWNNKNFTVHFTW